MKYRHACKPSLDAKCKMSICIRVVLYQDVGYQPSHIFQLRCLLKLLNEAWGFSPVVESTCLACLANSRLRQLAATTATELKTHSISDFPDIQVCHHSYNQWKLYFWTNNHHHLEFKTRNNALFKTARFDCMF